ncbi:hypothetical protein GQ43DRAFT_416691 [Delitschia confertaspora ATCC 74209]|uniref:Conserved oligomeric Golgi complex subunit 2 n=1 Tax=Delitschia confertaspora ATCC 74209 TaxID=1513339 RepID=A0A9P4JKC0_9PLEO|nr:hypothetical protein GQ43DRAFT_416691 [Delitschia confertaspora ATCC 74209]
MSRFYIDGSSSNASGSGSDDEEDTLPYPTPLQRNDFTNPSFSPSTYLSTLRNRHQTLEDLRSELRSRSQLLSKELLDLVNSNYQDFLTLGSSLKSGDEKVEEVRVGLLGFRKEVEAVKGVVGEREKEVEELVQERVEIRRRIDVGRRLIDLHAKLSGLEEKLMVNTVAKANGSGDGSEDGFEDGDSDDSDDSNEGTSTISISKLRRHVQQYRLVQEIARGVGNEHPFIAAQTPRLEKIRSTLLLDLETALREAKGLKAAGADRVMCILRVYAGMDESAEAVKVLKNNKTG